MALNASCLSGIFWIFLASQNGLHAAAEPPNTFMEKAALEMMGPDSPNENSNHFSAKKTFTSPLPAEQDLAEREKWTHMGYTAWEAANDARNPAEKQRYFVEAAAAWEKVEGDKNTTRMAGDAYFKAAQFSEEKTQKKEYLLKAARIYQKTGNPLKRESALRQAEEIL